MNEKLIETVQVGDLVTGETHSLEDYDLEPFAELRTLMNEALMTSMGSLDGIHDVIFDGRLILEGKPSCLSLDQVVKSLKKNNLERSSK
jgi:hypothetical protein